jgi:hypothetical protein
LIFISDLVSWPKLTLNFFKKTHFLFQFHHSIFVLLRIELFSFFFNLFYLKITQPYDPSHKFTMPTWIGQASMLALVFFLFFLWFHSSIFFWKSLLAFLWWFFIRILFNLIYGLFKKKINLMYFQPLKIKKIK